MKNVIVNLPFDGFYESAYSQAIDYEEESFIEYRVDDHNGETDADYESHWPDALRLDSDEIQEILIRVSSYDIAYRKIANWYVGALDRLLGETLGYSVKDSRQRYNVETKAFDSESYDRPSIRAAFESMDSPREYNFATDRVYATIPIGMMQLFFRKSRAEKHATLAAVIAERFTSYDGFISSYSRHIADWLSKPIADWDHNELGTLLLATMRAAGVDAEDSETRETLYESTIGDSGSYETWEAAVDWEGFESKRTESRAEKLRHWIDDDKDAAAIWATNHAEEFAAFIAAESTLAYAFEDMPAAPYHCPETIDLFQESGK